MIGRSWLLFDGDCAFCSSTARRLEPLLRRAEGDPTVIPWQYADLAALGVTSERCSREVVWVGDEGTFGGAAAFAAWLRHRGGPAAVVGRALTLPGLRRIADAAYRTVARNRHRLPGGTPACSPRGSR